MNIKAFTFSPFAENTYLLYDSTKEAVLVDPGCYFPEEKKQLSTFITEENLKLTKVIYTHCHLDHAFGSKYIADTYKGIEFWGPEAEMMFINSAKAHAQSFGLEMEQPPILNKYITEDDIITFGTTELIVISVPGHSPGGVCFYNK